MKMKLDAVKTALSPLLSSVIIILLLELITGSNAFSCSQPSKRQSGLLHVSTPPVEATEAASTNIRTAGLDSTQTNYELFLRFSPLIGGPPFLPLHVDIILVPQISADPDKIEAVLKSATNENEYADIHRFDFLPENPTDPTTIVRLMLLQGVPGRVRYRCFPLLNEGDLQGMGDNYNNLMQQQSENSSQRQDRGVAILFRFGSFSSRNKATVLSTAIDYANHYRTTDGKELRILGGKNCLSFALDMISHLDDVHGIDANMSLPKVF
jgi:hypothetical protein